LVCIWCHGGHVGGNANKRVLPGVPEKTGHCLISCNVKAVKAIAMKYRNTIAYRKD
jgi:hypothetical protein